MIGEHGVVGAAEFYTRELRTPHPELLRLLRGFGSQLGQYIELQQAEELARENEAIKMSIFETALDAVISIDASGNVVEFNPSAERLFGYSREETLGKEMAALVIPESLREAHRGALRRLAEGAEPRLLGQRLELTALRADGSEFPIELSIAAIESEEGHPSLFTGFVRDITARKEMERERTSLLVRERDSRRDAEAAQQQTEFIAEVGTVLDTALDYRRALEEFARIAVPRLGDWCVIDVLEPDGSIARLAAAHADPEPARPDRAAARPLPGRPERRGGPAVHDPHRRVAAHPGRHRRDAPRSARSHRTRSTRACCASSVSDRRWSSPCAPVVASSVRSGWGSAATPHAVTDPRTSPTRRTWHGGQRSHSTTRACSRTWFGSAMSCGAPATSSTSSSPAWPTA